MLDKRFKEITEDKDYIYVKQEKILKEDLSEELINGLIAKFNIKYDP